MIRDDRSMNYDLARGAVDGKVRFLRPNSVDADETHAQQRAQALDSQYYGHMGLRADDQYLIASNRPDTVPGYPPYLGPATATVGGG